MRIRSLPLLTLTIVGLLPTLALESPSGSRSVEDAPSALPQERSPAAAQDKAKTKPDPDSAETCAMCHTEIHKEWNGAKHNLAWTDPIYQESIKKKKRAKACHGCHIPDRVLARTGRKPKTRKKLLHEGVNCVACHEKDGKMHGPFGAKTDAHESVKDPLFTDANSHGICMSCHATKIDVVLPIGKDFKKANLAAKGKSCTGCHMQEVTRHLSVSPVSGEPVGEKRKGRRHRVLGPDDAEFCAKAFKLSASKKPDHIILTVSNEAGHRVPGLRIREFHFLVRQKDAAGKPVGAEQKIVVNHENGLLTLEDREFRLELAAGAAAIEVAIQHHFQGKLVAEIAKRNVKL